VLWFLNLHINDCNDAHLNGNNSVISPEVADAINADVSILRKKTKYGEHYTAGDKDGNEIKTQVNKVTISRLAIPNIADEKKLETERDRIIKINLDRYRPKQIQQESFINKLKRELIDFLT
jgi:hypothetical protein